MSLQLMSEINDNYHTAVVVHRELADAFWFISMPGYAMLNEYQYLDESMTQRKIKRYITSTYHTFAPDKLTKSANITEPLLGGKNRKSLKPEETWSIIKELFRIYRDWEEKTLQRYQQTATKIFANGETSTYEFVSDIIKEVKSELVFLNDKIIELSAMNWDMTQIVAEQDTYVERYEYLIRNLRGESKQYHHFNSNLDSKSRMSVLDKYPD